MRKNKQIVVDSEHGDCMRACLTSILDLPNDPAVIPLPGANEPDNNYHVACWKFLAQFGLRLSQPGGKAWWRDGYWIASVKSLNYPDKATHAIVMNGLEVAFDPSTKLTYPEGKGLLGEDVVLGCEFLEVIDPSLLHKLDEFRQSLSR